MACAVSGIRSAAVCTRTIAVITTAPRFRTCRAAAQSTSTSTGRARSRPRAPRRRRRGRVRSTPARADEPGAPGGEPPVQQPDLLHRRAAQRARPGQDGLRAEPQRSITGIGATPRRATPAAASRPYRTTAISQPPRPSGRAPDELRQRGERGEPLRPAEPDDQRGQLVAPARRRLEALPRGERVDLVGDGVQRRVVAAVDQVRQRARRRGVLAGVCSPAHGAAHRPSSCSAHGAAEAPAAGMRWVHGRSGTTSRTVSTAAAAARRDANGPSAPSRAVVTTDSRGNASAVGRPTTCGSGAATGGCSGAGARRSAAAPAPTPPARARTRRCRRARRAPPCRGPAGGARPR